MSVLSVEFYLKDWIKNQDPGVRMKARNAISSEIPICLASNTTLVLNLELRIVF